MGGADQTLPGIVARRYLERPDEEVCHLLDAQGAATPVTVRSLVRRAMAYAERLGSPRSRHEVTAICLYHGPDLHAAFLGALWAGHIPTMLPPPSPRMDAAKYAGQFARMLQHIEPARAVLDQRTLAGLRAHGLEPPRGTALCTPDEVPPEGDCDPHGAAPDDIALLQHSSGTTGLQKGVALSHAAVLAHNRRYAAHLGITPADRIASWLPLYHDMGFVACFLLPLLEGIFFVEMSPFDWVMRPAMLLEAVHRYRATLCWLPNFAFSFMATGIRPSQLPPDLDLRSVRAWISSSEPVLASSAQAFVDRFREQGVSETRLAASYAMAENVYAVTQSLPGGWRLLRAQRAPFQNEHRIVLAEAHDPDALTFVSNGPVVAGTELAVLDAAGRPLGAGQVGELALRGEYRFTGYFGREDLTARALSAEGWYRTGDLGFVFEGEVFVTGRLKDLIIVQGRNFYPTDAETVAAAVPGVNPGRVVAFGVPDEGTGTEGLVILVEAADGADPAAVARLPRTIRTAVAQELDVTPDDVRVVPSRFLVKSSSGKLARADNRDKYLRELRTPRS